MSDPIKQLEKAITEGWVPEVCTIVDIGNQKGYAHIVNDNEAGKILERELRRLCNNNLIYFIEGSADRTATGAIPSKIWVAAALMNTEFGQQSLAMHMLKTYAIGEPETVMKALG